MFIIILSTSDAYHLHHDFNTSDSYLHYYFNTNGSCQLYYYLSTCKCWSTQSLVINVCSLIACRPNPPTDRNYLMLCKIQSCNRNLITWWMSSSYLKEIHIFTDFMLSQPKHGTEIMLFNVKSTQLLTIIMILLYTPKPTIGQKCWLRWKSDLTIKENTQFSCWSIVA